jgi:hypothetical protein
MAKRLSCDENGMLVGFPHHDGSLDGVLMSGTDAHLALRSSQGEPRVLTLRRVSSLHVGDFCQGNIVGSLWLFRGDQLAHRAHVQRALMEKLQLDAGKLAPTDMVFLLDSSYGADVVAVCGEVEVSEAGVTLARSR